MKDSFMHFSQRKGLTPSEIPVQIDSIDKRLRNSIWSQFYKYTIGQDDTLRTNSSVFCSLYEYLWLDYLSQPLDDIPYDVYEFSHILKMHFFKLEWYDIYDFLEIFLEADFFMDHLTLKKDIVGALNNELKKNNSGFRIIGKKVCDIIDDQTGDSIEKSLNQGLFFGSRKHLTAAIKFLFDRENPDYRNSIKESVSALESACRDFTGDSSAILSKTINKIEKDGYIHPALRDSVLKLYGYAGDESGIRHAIKNDNVVSKEDAQFILSICSAFVNLLVSKYQPE